jgi:hypothetical protein
MRHSHLALGLAAALLAGAAQAQTGNPGGPINDNLGALDYGVCRGLDPKCFHDWKRPATTRYRILLFTRTGGPRHENLGPALAAGLNPPLTQANVVQNGMLALAARNGWTLDYTEDPRFMTQLGGYNAVVFFSSSRDALDDDGKTALRQYMRAGGGFVGVHNAFGAHYQWPWYEGLLGGTNFYDHGPHRTGEVVVVDRKDVSTRELPLRFAFKDEWYNLVPFPTRVRFLATVDETSWIAVPPAPAYPDSANPRRPPGAPLPRVVGSHPGHGDFHPVAWCQYYDGGKAWLTTLGHDAGVFSTGGGFAGAAEFQAMVAGGIKSVMGAEPFCR